MSKLIDIDNELKRLTELLKCAELNYYNLNLLVNASTFSKCPSSSSMEYLGSINQKIIELKRQISYMTTQRRKYATEDRVEVEVKEYTVYPPLGTAPVGTGFTHYPYISADQISEEINQTESELVKRDTIESSIEAIEFDLKNLKTATAMNSESRLVATLVELKSLFEELLDVYTVDMVSKRMKDILAMRNYSEAEISKFIEQYTTNKG